MLLITYIGIPLRHEVPTPYSYFALASSLYLTKDAYRNLGLNVLRYFFNTCFATLFSLSSSKPIMLARRLFSPGPLSTVLNSCSSVNETVDELFGLCTNFVSASGLAIARDNRSVVR